MLRIVPRTVPRVGRSYEHFPDGFELHLLPMLRGCEALRPAQDNASLLNRSYNRIRELNRGGGSTRWATMFSRHHVHYSRNNFTQTTFLVSPCRLLFGCFSSPTRLYFPNRVWNPSGKCSQERLTRGTVTSTMRKAAHPSGCARCGAGAGCSAIKYQSLLNRETLSRQGSSG